MLAKVLNESSNARKYALTFEANDEIIASLTDFARENHLENASFSGMGTLSSAVLAWFNESIKQYAPIPVEGPVEVLMLSGRISGMNDWPITSAHVVIGKPDGSAHGGHLLRAITQSKAHLFVEETRPRIHRGDFAGSATQDALQGA